MHFVRVPAIVGTYTGTLIFQNAPYGPYLLGQWRGSDSGPLLKSLN